MDCIYLAQYLILGFCNGEWKTILVYISFVYTDVLDDFNLQGKVVSLHPSVADLEKVQATLKQFVRDWSEEGAQERETCYQPIVEEIVSHFPTDLW